MCGYAGGFELKKEFISWINSFKKKLKSSFTHFTIDQARDTKRIGILKGEWQ